MLRSSVGALVVVALAGVAAAQTRTAPQVIADVQKTYAAVTDMTAVFEQKVTNVTFGKTSTSGGKVYLKRPSRMRWDYTATPRKGKPPKTARSFIADGTWLWMIDLENKQVVKQRTQDQLLPVAVAFLSGTSTWAADFRATLDTSRTYGTAGDHVVLLTPKTPSAAYKKLLLVVDPVSSQVRESIIIDAGDNVNRFAFASSNLAATNRDKLFEVDEKSPVFRSFRMVEPLPAKP